MPYFARKKKKKEKREDWILIKTHNGEKLDDKFGETGKPRNTVRNK